MNIEYQKLLEEKKQVRELTGEAAEPISLIFVYFVGKQLRPNNSTNIQVFSDLHRGVVRRDHTFDDDRIPYRKASRMTEL